jgi:RND family efflux transporter MFP subunit
MSALLSPPSRVVDRRRVPAVLCRARAWLALLGVAVLAACSGGAGGGGPGGGGPGGPPPVSVAPAVKRQIQDVDQFTARLEAAQQVEVRSRVSGTLERVHFRDGQRVAKGEVLFSIDGRPFAAEVARVEAQIAAVRSQLELARSEVVRAEKLVPIRAISAQELDQLKAAVAGGEASLKGVEAQLLTARLNLGYTRITAPIAGRVSRSVVTAGNLVGIGEPVLTTIVSTDKVYAWFDASEAQYLKFQKSARDAARPGTPAAATPVQMGLADDTGFPHKGTLDFVDNRLNPATATIRARAAFDNANGRFTPGLSARLQLAGTGSYDAVLVPDRAIGTDQTRKIVLAIGPNNIVTPKEVKLGSLIDGMRVVEGLNPGENIIVDGLQRAFPGAPVTPQVLQVDDKGMPIPPPPPGPPGAAGSAPKQ